MSDSASDASITRAIAFFDGQNLYYAAKKAFGYQYPNYEPFALASAVCATQGWELSEIRFYTGIHTAKVSPFWHLFWTSKLAAMGKRGILRFPHYLHYRNETIVMPDGSEVTHRVADEKGVDIHLALDLVLLALDQVYDVALIFSQDQDFVVAVDAVKRIAKQQNRWVTLASAFPLLENHKLFGKGIDKTNWIRIEKTTYDSCLDPNPHGYVQQPD